MTLENWKRLVELNGTDIAVHQARHHGVTDAEIRCMTERSRLSTAKKREIVNRLSQGELKLA